MFIFHFIRSTLLTGRHFFSQPLEPHVIYHNGPGQAYLSRSTEHDVRDYDGGGNWFKIAYFGALNDTWWSTRDQTGMNFTIPASTPPGQYLLRVEHLYVRYPFGTTQFYIACAQIDVRPPRSAVVERTPSEEYMARFPGAYHLTDEGECIPCRRAAMNSFVRKVAETIANSHRD